MPSWLKFKNSDLHDILINEEDFEENTEGILKQEIEIEGPIL